MSHDFWKFMVHDFLKINVPRFFEIHSPRFFGIQCPKDFCDFGLFNRLAQAGGGGALLYDISLPKTYRPKLLPPPTHWLWDLTWTLTMEGSAWLSWPVHRTLALVLSKTFNTQLSPSRIHISLWQSTTLNKNVNSGTIVLSFLGRPKEPFACKIKQPKNRAVSGLRSSHRARSDIATVSTV